MRKSVRILIGAAIGAAVAIGFTMLAGKPIGAAQPLAIMLAVVGAVVGLGASVLVGDKPSGDNQENGNLEA